ncbi:DUF1761 domain-containing protein [Candidatus Uhrbacteria bacterium]|nr:DUF1761 domain-containing protein [Candidatus Uhrbacteria bacterium]
MPVHIDYVHINYTAVLVASVLQFIFGAIWYTPIFGKTWGKIHGFDKLSQDEQKKQMKSMWQLLVMQFMVTVVTTFVFALLLNGFPLDWNIYGLAGFFWLGFVLPTEVSAVLFSRTDRKRMALQISIMAGASLVCLEIAAVVLQYMK